MVRRARLLAGVLLKAPRPIPAYGSAEWEALPAGDIRIFAAVLAAAECHYQEWTTAAVGERLKKELADMACPWCPDKIDVPGSNPCNDVRGVARMDNTAPRTGPSHAELERRRKGKRPADEAGR